MFRVVRRLRQETLYPDEILLSDDSLPGNRLYQILLRKGGVLRESSVFYHHFFIWQNMLQGF